MMADTLNKKSVNSEDKVVSTASHGTLESSNVNDTDKNSQPTQFLMPQRKKNAAFQITSVTIGSLNSIDGYDDSGDDFDESHTDDISDVADSSRITDIENETPSFSDDIFSRDDAFINHGTTTSVTTTIQNCNILTSEDVVTSSSGSECVDSRKNIATSTVSSIISCSTASTATAATSTKPVETFTSESTAITFTSVANSNINATEFKDTSNKESVDTKILQARNTPPRTDRFRVVKIETTEPFKRGRWMCMDSLDHSGWHNKTFTSVSRTNTKPEQIVHQKVEKSEPSQIVHYVAYNEGDMSGTVRLHRITLAVQDPTANPATYTTAFQANFHVQNVYQHPLHQQILHSQQFTSSLGSQCIHLVNTEQHCGQKIAVAGTPPTQTVKQQDAHSKDSHYMAQIPVRLLSPQLQMQNQLPQQSVIYANSYSSPVFQHTTLNANDTQQYQASAVDPNTSIPHKHNVLKHSNQETCASIPPEQISGLQKPMLSKDAHSVKEDHVVKKQYISVSKSKAPISTPSESPASVPSQSVRNGTSNLSSVDVNFEDSNLGQGQTPKATVSQPSPHHSTRASTKKLPTTCVEEPDSKTKDSKSETSSENEQGAPKSETTTKTGETQSKTSAHSGHPVAIDNKIEQAMDLVKSHLMFAVREEVEILKEKIAELMERISQLESENALLRSHAPPEIVQQLKSSQLVSKNATSGQSQSNSVHPQQTANQKESP